MDRRSFIKLFSATAATISASKILANIPEAEPKIQLLEEKSIVSMTDAIITFTDSVIAYCYKSNDNGFYSKASNNNYVPKKWIQGLISGQIEIEIYLFDIEYNILSPGFYFTFNIPTSNDYHIINNKKFLCTNIEIKCQHKQLITASIMGTEFYA